jgi:hypothetical protein
VVLSEEAYDRIREYAEFIGIPVARATNKAIMSWMDNTGDDLMSFIDGKRKEQGANPKLTSVLENQGT